MGIFDEEPKLKIGDKVYLRYMQKGQWIEDLKEWEFGRTSCGVWGFYSDQGFIDAWDEEELISRLERYDLEIQTAEIVEDEEEILLSKVK